MINFACESYFSPAEIENITFLSMSLQRYNVFLSADNFTAYIEAQLLPQCTKKALKKMATKLLRDYFRKYLYLCFLTLSLLAFVIWITRQICWLSLCCKELFRCSGLNKASNFSWAERTAKTVYRKFETNIPRNETARPQAQFLHECFCERFIYSHDRSAYSAPGK